jgi:hypothetical protein
MSYTFKPKTAEPSPAFYKPPSAGFTKSSSWGSSKPAPPPEPKLDVKDMSAFPSLGPSPSLPPRASLRLPSKELPPPPKLGAWTAVAAKPAEPKPAEPKPAAAAAAEPTKRRNAFDYTHEGEEDDYHEDEEAEEGEFNAHLASNRRRGDKGVW